MEERQERYCELLIVKADNHQRYVVKAPTNEAHKGYLVEFDTESGTQRGVVEDLMWCIIDKEAYRCIQLITPLYALRTVYHRVWNVEEEPDWDK